MNPDQGHGAAPQLLKTVEFPLLLGEDVDDNVAEVHQEPAGVRVSLGSQHRLTGLFQALVHRFPNRLPLPLRFNGHQDEGVRVGADLSHVEQENVARLSILGNFDCLASEFDAIDGRIRTDGSGLFRHEAILRHRARRNNAGVATEAH